MLPSKQGAAQWTTQSTPACWKTGKPRMASNRNPTMDKPRTPKLDPVWMAALGFTLVDKPTLHVLQWRHTDYDFQLSDDMSPTDVATRTIRKASALAVREQQIMLRNALLPAMGLEEHGEHDNYGDESRRYIRAE